jgi:hypothetical protein
MALLLQGKQSLKFYQREILIRNKLKYDNRGYLYNIILMYAGN